MSGCGLQLELGSSHRRGRCKLFIIDSAGHTCLQFCVMTPFLLDSLTEESTGVLP